MAWQAIVVTVASLGFPTLALLYFIGGTNYHGLKSDQQQPPR